MRILLTMLISTLLASCGSAMLKDDDSHLAINDKVSLVQPLQIAKLDSHVIFQDGVLVKQAELEPYQTSCIYEVNQLGPTDYPPENFIVTRINRHEEMYSDTGAVVRYYTEFHLMPDDGGEPVKLVCQVLDDTMRYHSFSVPEIQQAVGNYFRF